MPNTSPAHNTRGSAALPWKVWGRIGTVLLWAAFNYTVGDQLYALSIVAFFVALAVIVRRRFLYVVVPAVLVVWLYTPVPATLTALVRLNWATVRQASSQITIILTPNSGREVLPREVRHMLALLQSKRLNTYRVSDAIWSSSLQQRLVEGLWPARLDPASPYIFRLRSEQPDSACSPVRQRENVILEHCP